MRLAMSGGWRAVSAYLLAAVVLPAALLMAAPKAGKGPDDDLGLDADTKPADQQGDFSVTLVGPDGKSIDAARFVRGVPGRWAVSEFPHVFALDGQPLFTAGTTLDAKVPAAGSVAVFCKPEGDAADGPQYSARCTARIPAGQYAISPFGLKFDVAGRITPRHPALSVDGKALSIRTAAVTFKAVSDKGAALPLNNFGLFHQQANLLENLVDAKGALSFSTLTLHLPVGLEYRSSLGTFAIDPRGALTAVNLDKGVKLDGSTLTRTTTQASAVSPADPVIGKGYWLSSHNLRRVFKRGEVARFDVIAAGPCPAGELSAVISGGGRKWDAGKLNLPAVEGAATDSRLFLLDTGKLAPGKFELTLAHADAHPFAFEVVDLLPTTPLFLFTCNACGESDFTLDSAGLAQLQATGVRCWTTYGHGSVLGRLGQVGGTFKVPYPDAPADAPAELRHPVDMPRALLDDCLRHGLFTIDYENRRAGWYNEGLAFHHTHPMSVDRMVRRIQIFAQELEDYPAMAGMTYTWFPSLGGYTEGGVATDPFFGTRMDILRANVKKATGLEPLTQKEYEQFRKGTGDRRALADKARDYWRAEQRMGWLDTFALYNRKLREVRGDLIATTSENAGHDAGKSLPDIGGAHDAMSFESYTDFGDWPMSAGFVTDWAHGQLPGKPAWQSVDPSSAEPALVGKQFAKFARGAEGIANGVHGPNGARSNAKRALTNRFLERYGSLVTDWSPDTHVGVCASEIQHGLYDVHALHSHLTRLGYGPVVVSERTLESSGVPANLKAIFIPNLRLPFGGKAEAALKAFAARGGKVVIVGEKVETIDGAVHVEAPLKTLWDVGGFPAHVPFFAEFKKVRPALEKALADIGLSPRNGAAPEKAVIFPSTSAGVKYVTVVSSPLESKDSEFVPVSGISVKVADATKVLNLVTGAELPVKDGAVTVDLIDEPVAFLALLADGPQSVTLRHPARATAGDVIELAADVAMSGGARPPVEYVVADAAGAVRAKFYRLANDKAGVSYGVPQTDAAGDYSVTATELLTGLTARAKVSVAAARELAAVVPTGAVFLPHPNRLPPFVTSKQPVRVVVEESQADSLPQAERIVAALRKAGRDAAIQRVSDASYDMYWLKWLPTPAVDKVLAKIDAGEVVGYRGDLKPYVNTANRAHDPTKGGWEDVGPRYVIRTDVILFSGGQIAQSLSALSDWTQTPNFPGKGRGVLDVALSPFWADRKALSVIARDDAGRARAVDRLIEVIEAGHEFPVSATFAAPAVAAASASVNGTGRVAIETPLKGFVPPALVLSLAASPDGSAVVQLKGMAVAVTPGGRAQPIPASGIPPVAIDGGTAFGGAVEITAVNPAWHFATAWKVKVRRFTADDSAPEQFDVPQAFEGAGDMYDGWDRGFAAAPDGRTYFAPRDGGGFFLFDLARHEARAFDEPVRDLAYYEQVRNPVGVTAAHFSPDGALVAYTVGNHPTGYGGMMGPPQMAFATALRVVDAQTGKTVWAAQTEAMGDTSLSAAGDCLAIADAGRRVALIDWEHNASLFDGQGKRVARMPIFDWKSRYQGNGNPKPTRCELSRDGNTALFVSDGNVLVTDGDGKTLAAFAVPALSDARLSPDGATVFVADQDGLVTAFARAGDKRWTVQTRGERPRLAPTAAGILIAEGAGNLLSADLAGKVLRTVPVAGLKVGPAEFTPLPMRAPPVYREPQTLAVLQAGASAKLVKRWEPQGAARDAFGRTFHLAPAGTALESPGAGKRLVHLAYRLTAKPATVTLSGGDKPLTFVLDLPTPEYRVVDLPYDAKSGVTVTIGAPGLEIADLSIYSFAFPGSNSLYVRPAGAESDSSELGVRNAPHGGGGGKKPAGDPDLILDDKEPGGAAKAASGKMKNAAIFSNNADPDQIEGHYIRATGNVLDAFDGQRFVDGKPSAWTKSKVGPFGSRLLVDLNHAARPRLCATYERTLVQSEVMRGVAVLKGKRTDFELGEAAGPDRLARERRVVVGVIDNDQFFNAFDTRGVEMEALGVYVFPREGKDLGLSEVELYE